MALIAKEFVPPKKEQCTIRLDPETIDLLEHYCRFLESSQNYVVERLLRYTFQRDRDFRQWLLKNRTTAKKEGDKGAPANR